MLIGAAAGGPEQVAAALLEVTTGLPQEQAVIVLKEMLTSLGGAKSKQDTVCAGCC
jgi:chemotaxis response regulator CheB